MSPLVRVTRTRSELALPATTYFMTFAYVLTSTPLSRRLGPWHRTQSAARRGCTSLVYVRVVDPVEPLDEPEPVLVPVPTEEGAGTPYSHAADPTTNPAVSTTKNRREATAGMVVLQIIRQPFGVAS